MPWLALVEVRAPGDDLQRPPVNELLGAQDPGTMPFPEADMAAPAQQQPKILTEEHPAAPAPRGGVQARGPAHPADPYPQQPGNSRTQRNQLFQPNAGKKRQRRAGKHDRSWAHCSHFLSSCFGLA